MKEVRYCIRCKDSFVPKTEHQIYCHKAILLQCSVCGENYQTVCKSRIPQTCENIRCRRKAATVAVRNSERRCRTCGDLFHPKSNNQVDCLKLKHHKCKVCGTEFIAKCSGRTEQQFCSKDCLHTHIERQSDAKSLMNSKICVLCGEPFHPTFANQKYCSRNHFSECVVCGSAFQINPKLADRRTCSVKCAEMLNLKMEEDK